MSRTIASEHAGRDETPGTVHSGQTATWPGSVGAGCAWQGRTMCRNIRVLYNFEPPATPDEIEAAAIQYVRKVSGSTRPSAGNQAAFDAAVTAVAEATRSLLEAMVTKAPPRDRETEAAKARAQAEKRYGRSSSAR